MEAMVAAEEEKRLRELQDLHDAIVLDEAYFTKRNLSGRGRNVVPTSKQKRDVQTEALNIRFGSGASRRRSTGSMDELGDEGEDNRLVDGVDLNLRPRTFLYSGRLTQYDPDKLLRKTLPRKVFVFSDLIVVANAKEGSEVCEAQQVLYVKDLRLRYGHLDGDEDRWSFELIVPKTRSRPQSAFKFMCEGEGSWRQWVEELENTLVAYHRQTEITQQLGWFHEVLQGNLHSAAYLGDVPLLRRHLKQMSAGRVDLPDLSGMRPLHWACMRGQEVCVRMLLDRGADVDAVQSGGNTPLHLASASGHENIVRLLIERGADLKLSNLRGHDAVFMAVLCGHASKGLPWLLQLLHTKGMDLNRTDRSGAAPLHLCAERNLARPVKMLVDAGADVNIRHLNKQLTPLQLACSSRHPDVETIRSFLDKGAYPNWKDVKGRTAFDLALRSLPSPAPGSSAQAIEPGNSNVIFSASLAQVDVSEVLISPRKEEAGGETPSFSPDGGQGLEADSVSYSMPSPSTERWRAMEATLQIVGDWVVRTLPALLELVKKGARFDFSSLQSLRPSVRAAVLEARGLWEKKTAPDNFLAFVKTRELSGEDLRLHKTVWSKDDTSPFCQLCSDTFSLTNRRHHCRACGELCCVKCSSKRMLLSAAKGEALTPPSGVGKERKKGGDETERVCDGCFNRLIFEASLPSLDHFRIRQLKKCALDLMQSLEGFVEELDGAEQEVQQSSLRDTLFSFSPTNVNQRLSFRSPSVATVRSPNPAGDGAGGTDEAVVQLLKARQSRLLNVENTVAKFLEASDEYQKISKKLIEQKIENNRLWGSGR